MDKRQECCECKWIGTERDKKKVPRGEIRKLKISDMVCPLCGSKEFYMIDE